MTQKLMDLRRLLHRWLAGAAPNFADPEATDLTLAYWQGVQRCAYELEAVLNRSDPSDPHQCEATNLAVAADGRIYCAHCGWNDPADDPA